MLSYFEQSRDQFLTAIDGLTDAQWNWKPAPDRWSVSNVAEHIVLAEDFLFANVKKAVASPPNPDWEAQTKGKTEFIERVMAPRLGRAQAPQSIVPAGGMTLDEAKQRFEKQRVEIVEFATTSEIPLNEYTVEHPMPAFKTLNAHQWLIYGPLHTMRHVKHIAELKATPGYPL